MMKMMQEKTLDKAFWNERYLQSETGWDLGQVSPPLAAYIEQLEDKNLKILIPGCGNAYEAQYLLDKGFKNITLIDIAPALVEKLQKQYENNPAIRIIEGDLFKQEEKFELILEQTFFCALNPNMRKQYVEKMHALLKPGGRLAGVLFNTCFPTEGPPFGGSLEEYRALFQPLFDIKTLESCQNSIGPRAGNEVFLIAIKK